LRAVLRDAPDEELVVRLLAPTATTTAAAPALLGRRRVLTGNRVLGVDLEAPRGEFGAIAEPRPGGGAHHSTVEGVLLSYRTVRVRGVLLHRPHQGASARARRERAPRR
jgi:hypothetical protein